MSQPTATQSSQPDDDAIQIDAQLVVNNMANTIAQLNVQLATEVAAKQTLLGMIRDLEKEVAALKK